MELYVIHSQYRRDIDEVSAKASVKIVKALKAIASAAARDKLEYAVIAMMNSEKFDSDFVHETLKDEK